MTVWALSDPHLSFSSGKPMHIFGEHWREHWKKIEAAWRERVGPEDVVLVTGDISWARRFAQARPDLEWLDALPGHRKLIVRGNHDHWWPAGEAERRALPKSLLLLAGEAVRVNGHVFCGTGCWLTPQDPYFEALDRRAYERELAALETALDAATKLAAREFAGGENGRDENGGSEIGGAEKDSADIHLLVHFSPYSSQGKPTEFDALLRRYPVRTVTFGHFHLPEEWEKSPRGEVKGVHYTLASADFIDFAPVRLPIQ